MFTPITFPSALSFWLTFDGKRKIKLLDSESIRQMEQLPTADQLCDFARAESLRAPLHVLVPEKSLRNKGTSFKSHVIAKRLPPESFVLISDIPVIGPELCFLLAAKHLTVSELSLLATDLCGTYALDKQAQFGQISRNAITSVQSISEYISRVEGIDGIKKARTAISYALDGSHSPMESRIAVAAHLPSRHGGFAMYRPMLNKMEKLSSDGSTHFGREECCCDMVWEEQRLIVEYDSDLIHSTQNQIRQDKKKMTALSLSDYKVIVATKDDFRNYHTIESLFLTMKRKLGMRTKAEYYKASEKNRKDLIVRFFLINGGWNWLDWANDM